MWAALQSAVLEAFSPYSPYGAPALGGALMFSAFYYAGRRQARGRQISIKGFVRSIFPGAFSCIRRLSSTCGCGR